MLWGILSSCVSEIHHFLAATLSFGKKKHPLGNNSPYIVNNSTSSILAENYFCCFVLEIEMLQNGVNNNYASFFPHELHIKVRSSPILTSSPHWTNTFSFHGDTLYYCSAVKFIVVIAKVYDQVCGDPELSVPSWCPHCQHPSVHVLDRWNIHVQCVHMPNIDKGMQSIWEKQQRKTN